MVHAKTEDRKATRLLLRVAAAAEVPTGLLFLLLPGLPVRILFGQDLDGTLPDLIGRILGTSIFALGLAGGLAAADAENRAAAGVVISLLFYYALSAALLAYARFAFGMSGVGMWPALAAHILMAAWCAWVILQRA